MPIRPYDNKNQLLLLPPSVNEWEIPGEKRGKRGTLPYFIDSLRPSAMLGTCQG